MRQRCSESVRGKDFCGCAPRNEGVSENPPSGCRAGWQRWSRRQGCQPMSFMDRYRDRAPGCGAEKSRRRCAVRGSAHSESAADPGVDDEVHRHRRRECDVEGYRKRIRSAKGRSPDERRIFGSNPGGRSLIPCHARIFVDDSPIQIRRATASSGPRAEKARFMTRMCD